MKERPILFNGDMVRAILDGRKTQTRRPMKEQPHEGSKFHGMVQCFGELRALFWCEGQPSNYGTPLPMHVGDRLWVKETFGFSRQCDDVNEQERVVVYKACEPFHLTDAGVDRLKRCNSGCLMQPNHYVGAPSRWTPSIHMPRWASRIDLEITRVWVERVRDMEGMNAADSDALKEGVNKIHHEGGNYYYSAFRNHPHPQNWTDPFLAFKELWQSIYGTWDSNPWVWAYEFRRIKP